MRSFKTLTWVLSLAVLSAMGFGQNTISARPGTINYVEGQASIEGRVINAASVGKASLQAGQVLATANGKTELLLTPGIFLRIGDDTTIKMVSPDLTHTEVRLEQGRANIEVDQIYSQNTVLIDMKNGQTQLLKNGLYTFDAANSTVRVFDGKAAVYPGANFETNIKPVDVKGGRQLVLNGEPLKPQRFNKDQAAVEPLYKWSSLRSNYLGQANLSLAQEYAGYSGFYPGWYWAGSPFGYTWLPGAGLFWNPFGYGFYSPYYLYGGGFVYGGFHRGFYGHRGGYIHHGGHPVTGTVHGNAAPRSSGGFHGGGGGFHGGGHGVGGHR